MIDLEHSLVRWILFVAVLIVLIAVKVYVRKRRKEVAAQMRETAKETDDSHSDAP
jgi:hypothetical protein